MSPIARYAVFLTVITTLTVGVHYYLWTRFVRDPGLTGPWAKLVTGALVAMALVMFAGPLLGRLTTGPTARWVATAAFTWMGTLLLLVVLLGGGEITRVAMKLLSTLGSDDAAPMDPQRRLLLARLVGGGAAVGAFGLSSVAFAAAARPPKVVRQSVPIERLPGGLEGLKIVQISDLHVSSTIRRPYVEKVVQMANELQPDLVVLTGDLVDGSPEMLRDDIAPLGELKARWGAWAVTGNHEYYSGADRWIAHLDQLGIRTLRNEHVTLGENGAQLDLAGIDDAQAARFGGDHGPDLAKAVAGRSTDRPLVLLAHQPKQVTGAPQHGVDLQLSGHTHGGQIWPFGFLVRLAQPYVAGLHRHAEKTWIYVSRGTGYWGPPMRLGAQHELTLLTLQRATNDP